MPNLIATLTGEAAKIGAAEGQPCGPGFAAETVAKVDKLEVWGSAFKDPGPDWTEFKVFDEHSAIIDTRRVGGY